MRSSASRQSRTALPDKTFQEVQMVKGAAGPGVYSATYSNIPVYEFQFGPDLKEHVMRRRHDDWINATHILKAAGFDKPARTRILEREVQKEVHEKVQGGYGKYQGTWVPLEHGEALAHRNGVYEKLRTIFEFVPGNDSPPPAPKHTTNKPKVPKKPAVPKFHSTPAPKRVEEDYDNISAHLNDDETPDDTTVASASFLDEDDRYDMSQQSTGHRKRKRDEHRKPALTQTEINHRFYADELLDYFMIAKEDPYAARPEPPPNFMPDFIIDTEEHTAIHWASAMGDIEVIKQLKRFGANLACRNERGETPLMRAALFTNCQDRQVMPKVVQELFSTIDLVDEFGSTVIHHAAAITSSESKQQCSRYYLDVILNKMSESLEQDEVQRLLDLQDMEGNTACHIAARNHARKCVRALIGRGASTDILNKEGITTEELIQELNNSRRQRNLHVSSSPFAPDSHRHISFQEPMVDPNLTRHTISRHSEAAMTMESKVTPLILEKFHDLAKSFDDELIDRDHSEKEAKRILNMTRIELGTLREQIAELAAAEEDDVLGDAEEAQYQRAKASLLGLVEHQQQLRLVTGIHREEGMMNGHLEMEGESGEEKVELYKMLDEAARRRVQLVEEYGEALGMVAMGENGESYKVLTARCLGVNEEELDGEIDGLIKVLEDDRMDGIVGRDMILID